MNLGSSSVRPFKSIYLGGAVADSEQGTVGTLMRGRRRPGKAPRRNSLKESLNLLETLPASML